MRWPRVADLHPWPACLRGNVNARVGDPALLRSPAKRLRPHPIMTEREAGGASVGRENGVADHPAANNPAVPFACIALVVMHPIAHRLHRPFRG